jgi:hypothetical protein
MAALCDGLASAHEAGVLHLDLKPENVLLMSGGRWCVGDFGLAAAYEELAQEGGAGTPAFAAPEQILGETPTPQADAYALASVAVFALTGRPPYAGVDTLAIVGAQLRGAIDPEVLASLPPTLQEWAVQALHVDPGQRFASLRAMREAWLWACERVPGWQVPTMIRAQRLAQATAHCSGPTAMAPAVSTETVGARHVLSERTRADRVLRGIQAVLGRYRPSGDGRGVPSRDGEVFVADETLARSAAVSVSPSAPTRHGVRRR